jgi:two-component system chemotaxis response regulator CheV
MAAAGTLFDEIEKRTQLALSNQMEMLVFFLTDKQMYGINVFKIVEVLECPKTVTKMPNSHPMIKGTIDFRGKAVIVIDMSDFLGLVPQNYKNDLSYVIICEYNQNIQGFIINSPDKLITRSWEDIKSPAGLLSESHYLTAIAYSDDDKMIQILDIEKILNEVVGLGGDVPKELIDRKIAAEPQKHHILLIDDSKTAKMLVESVIEQLGFEHTYYDSAVKAFSALKENPGLKDKFDMVICDVEMPGMDGFTFTRKVKEDVKLKDMYVMLHTSMSNPTNKIKAEQVGADEFIAKFKPDVLAASIMETVKNRKRINRSPAA